VAVRLGNDRARGKAMADFSATDVAFSGFRFAREHPRTVALWAAIQLAISVAFGVAIVLLAGPAFMELQQAQGQKDPAAALAVIRQLLPFYCALFIFFLVFYPVLYATMSRAVLRPDESKAGYLRLGMDEVRQLLLMLLIAAVGIGVEIAFLLVVVVPGLVIGLFAHGAAGVTHFLFFVAGFCAAAFCAVRLSLCSPLTFDRRRVNLFGSWQLTSGRFWKMLGTYLLVLALCAIIAVLVLLVDVAVAAVLGGGLKGVVALFKPDPTSIGAYFSPARMVMGVIGAGVSGLLWPVLLMPPVEIYKSLRPVAP
jgi:hypothetical protein